MRPIKTFCWGRLLALASLLCLAGCFPLLYHSYDEHYPGLAKRLREATEHGGVMQVITVHGMGNHVAGYSTNMADRLGHLLKLSRDSAYAGTNLISTNGVTNYLLEYSYGDGKRKIFFHELTWTPTTILLKSNAFSKDTTLSGHRVLVNKDLKSGLMDQAFPDAVLYLNPGFRGAMQEPIFQTIQIVARESSSNDAIVLITESLGSKMTFDTAMENDSADSVGHFEERTTDILMLANQLPLLHLGTATNLAGGPQETEIKKFLKRSYERRGNNAAEIHVVAATDPNDLLSYPLTKADVVPDESDATNARVSLSNIYSHNASAILFVFENPEDAHDNYDQNCWLLKKLVTGYTNSAVNSH